MSEAANNLGETPLHIAALHGNKLDCQQILQNNPDLINAKRDDGWTPLHCAVANGFLDIIRILIHQKADPTIASANGATPKDLAMNKWAINQLLEGTDPFKIKSPLFKCYNFSNGKDVSRILKSWKKLYDQQNLRKQGISLAKWFETTEFYGQLYAVKLDGETLLHLAASHGNIKLVTQLCEFGFDPNVQRADGWTPLHCAVKKGNLEMCQLLLKRGAKSMRENNLHRTPLFYVTNVPNTNEISLLIEQTRLNELISTVWFPQSLVTLLPQQVIRNGKIKEYIKGGVYNLQLLTRKFCRALSMIINDDSPLWIQNNGIAITDSSSAQLLNLLFDPITGPLAKFFEEHFPQFPEPRLRDASLVAVRNREELKQMSIQHTDYSDITVNICLRKRKLSGSNIIFLSSETPVSSSFRTGWCFVYKGDLVHEIEPVEDGERINIIARLHASRKVEDPFKREAEEIFKIYEDGLVIQRLPVEVLVIICSYLPIVSVIALERTCKELHDKCSNEFIWRDICWNKLPHILHKGVDSGYKEAVNQFFSKVPENLSLTRNPNINLQWAAERHLLLLGAPGCT